MKKLLLLTALVATGAACLAQDMGRVLSSTPVWQQVGIPRQVCTTEQVPVYQPRSGAGAVIGALAGGAVANAATHGSGQAAATLLGMFGGAVIGDQLEGPGASTQLQNVQRCSTQTFYETRAVSYNVVYEFAGKQYAAQMPHDPGPTIALQLTPIGASAPPPPTNWAPAPQAYAPPEQVIVMPPPVYYSPPSYPPVSLNLGLGYWGGYRSGHWHRR
jgi:uncharacterized protein YcfJ